MALEGEVAAIVSAYTKRNQVSADQLATLISTVYAALSHLGSAPVEQPIAELVPAISIRRSIQPDAIICLDCGKRQKMLKRHLATAHKMTEADYRARWKLPGDYLLVAPDYSVLRSESAKARGFGRRRNPANQSSAG